MTTAFFLITVLKMDMPGFLSTFTFHSSNIFRLYLRFSFSYSEFNIVDSKTHIDCVASSLTNSRHQCSRVQCPEIGIMYMYCSEEGRRVSSPIFPLIIGRSKMLLLSFKFKNKKKSTIMCEWRQKNLWDNIKDVFQ